MAINSPSFKGFHLTDFLLKVIIWRQDLSLFFQDVTSLIPRPFQSQFFHEVQDLTCKNIVIVAGRGIGKTLALAVVALWYVLVLSITENRPFKVVILAGSLDQAKICYTYIMDFINNSTFLQKNLGKEPNQSEIVFKDGSWIRPLPASEKSIRGHHPDLLIIDEAAHVEEDIVYAALPMTAPSPFARQIFSTTPSEGYSWIEDKWEHQNEYSYPTWKFFNWNAESFLPPDQVALLKKMLPANEYTSEIQGLPYKREGKVFRLEDLKECQKEWTSQNNEGDVYAGIDWGYCLTGDHEVLTLTGWKRLDKLDKSSQVLTYNKKKNSLEFQVLSKYYRKKTSRIVSQWQNKNLSIAGSWRHVIPVLDREKEHFHEHLFSDNLAHHYLIRKAKFVGYNPRKIMGYNSQDFIRFLGWYLTEGSVECSKKGYRISIGQLKENFRQEIVDLFQRMGLNPKLHPLAIKVSNQKLAKFCAQLGHARTRFIPSKFKNCSPKLLNILKETMMKGDGDLDGYRFNTFSKRLADDFQEIVIKIGHQIPYIEKRGRKGFRIHLLNRDSSPNKSHYSEKEYNGYHVGLEVPNEFVLVRRDGKPCIVHNYPAPTVLVIAKKIGDIWQVLYTEGYLAHNFEEMHKKIKEVCESYNVINVYTDSTDKGENLRLSAEGLPVTPVAFKSEKSTMISNLRMLVEQHRLKLDSLTQQRLISQMLDYVYDSKRNDDFVDALMLAVKANPMVTVSTFDLEAILKEMTIKRKANLPEDQDRKKEIGNRLKEMGRM